MLPADVHSIGNGLEAVLWFAISAILLIGGIRRPASRSACWLAAVAFFAFGLSDVVEIQTGAWWRPWWLLVWKAACVAIFFFLFLNWRFPSFGWKPTNNK